MYVFTENNFEILNYKTNNLFIAKYLIFAIIFLGSKQQTFFLGKSMCLRNETI